MNQMGKRVNGKKLWSGEMSQWGEKANGELVMGWKYEPMGQKSQWGNKLWGGGMNRWGEKVKVKNFDCRGGIGHGGRHHGESTMDWGKRQAEWTMGEKKQETPYRQEPQPKAVTTNAPSTGHSKAHIFYPVSIETRGSRNDSAIELVQEIGKRISVITEYSRETAFRFHRLSFALQRGMWSPSYAHLQPKEQLLQCSF